MISHDFIEPISTADVDLRLSISVGQVFRWNWDPETSTARGTDGDAWFVIEQRPNEWHVRSNHPRGRIAALFDLDGGQTALRARLLLADPGLAPHLRRTQGLVLMKPQGIVETFFCFLCTSNNHIPRITQMAASLGSWGTPAESGFFLFPSLAVLAKKTESEYRTAGFGYRGATIPLCAQQILERGGLDWLNALKTVPHEQARRHLMELPGIGPKLADCICLFALHQGLAVPVDTHLWHAACLHAFPQWAKTSLTQTKREAVRLWFQERFGDLAGMAHQVLFVSRLLESQGVPPG